jgi:branched-chain amino acid transport system permease protein
VSAGSLFSQFMSGLSTAMLLFLIASGLSLVFGVMRVINFAHGSFYMVGAYIAWQFVAWIHPSGAGFWIAVLGAAFGVALLGFVVERLFFRWLYGREELYQLLFTYALVLILGDAAKFIWGTGQLSVSAPPALAGSIQLFGTTQPTYNLFIIALGPVIAFSGWLVLNRTGIGRLVRAAQMDREMLDALGANVGSVYTGMFVFSSFLAGLSGGLVTPIQSIVPGMDVLIIVQAFIIVVIGGMGSLWGTFWGAVIYGQVFAFGIPLSQVTHIQGFSLYAVYALMAVILIVRPWGLFGRPL